MSCPTWAGLRDYHKPFGIQAARQLSQQYPHLPLLIYSNHVQHLPDLEAMLNQHQAGASYLHKGDGPDELEKYLRATVDGAKWRSSYVSRTAVPPPHNHPYFSPSTSPKSKFTPAS
ncbi:MAG: hypothetical protein IPL28_27870 [Chloroflexi bacterium]|nr:hypothetical protein [Chloroflexota bacterium]